MPITIGMGVNLGTAILVSTTISAAMTAGLFVFAAEADERADHDGTPAPEVLAFAALADAEPAMGAEADDGALVPLPDPGTPTTSIVPAAPALVELDADGEADAAAITPTTVTIPAADEPAPVATVPAAEDPATPTTVRTPTTAPLVTIAPATTPTTRPAPTTTRPPATVPAPTTTAPARPAEPAAPTTTTTVVAPDAPGDFRLVWSDEFDTFDASSWTKEHSTYGDGNNELQCYLPENVTVVDGHLRLTATNGPAECPWETRDFGSGMVRTRDKVDWTRGRFEIRARMPEGQGFWPAAWMSPTDGVYGRWPNSGEIDIVEALGHRTNRIIGSLHWMSPTGHRVDNREHFSHDGFTSDWHVYSLTWEEGLFIWEVDGIEYHRVESWNSTAGAGDAPFDQPFYLKLNLAVGGRAPGAPDATTPFPAHYDIDWVRVYQR